ncbi:MAG: hypothetical protein ACYDAG_01725 [Chloroflexota bacterium]
MIETYDSVVDRMGAFNAATEKLSKGKLAELRCVVAGRPDAWLRLVRTADGYRFEVAAATVPESGKASLDELRFAPIGEVYARDVRKAERSWSIASQIEDILADVFGLPPDGQVEIDIAGDA